MTFDMLKKIGRQSSIKSGKGEMCRDESETSRCCDLSMVDESSGYDDELKLMEIHDDLKAKTSQLAILRETLSTMSATMRRQECQLEGKDIQIETYIKIIEEKTTECDEWKSKYETLASTIESRENASEKLHYQPCQNIAALPPGFDALDCRRPWNSTILSSHISMIHDDSTTTSDSINDSNPLIDINANLVMKRFPKRIVKSKRKDKARDGTNSRPITLSTVEQLNVRETTNSLLKCTNCDGNHRYDETHGTEKLQVDSDYVPPNGMEIVQDDLQDAVMEATKSQQYQKKQAGAEINTSSFGCDCELLHGQSESSTESVGFNFEVEIPFSDQESEDKSTHAATESVQNSQDGCEAEEVNANRTVSSEVEILSLNHFIQLYDKYEVDEYEAMQYEVDVTTETNDDDEISVVSYATMDSSAGPIVEKAADMNLESVASVLSIVSSTSPTADKASCPMEEKQTAMIDLTRKQEKRKLRKRIIRTARREAEKARFNCEVVEC